MSVKENLNTQEDLQRVRSPGLYYVIPAQVFDDDRLNDDDKLVYTLLSGLSFSTGYCFAKDKWLAAKRKRSEREIQRSLEDLENLGYIRRETKKVGMEWERKIFICHGRVSNNCYEATSVSPSKRRRCRDRGVSGDASIYKGIVSEELVSEEKGALPPDPPPPIKPPLEILRIGKHVSVKKEAYESLCSEFGRDGVDECFLQINDWIDAKGNKGYKDYAAAARNWLRRDSKAQKVGKNASSYQKNKAEVRTAQETLRSLGSPKAKQIYLLDTQGERFVIRLDTGDRISLELESSEFLDKFLKMFNLTKGDER